MTLEFTLCLITLFFLAGIGMPIAYAILLSSFTYLAVGGQALIEGVMMRGKRNWALAVRLPAGGVHVEEHELRPQREGSMWKWLVLSKVDRQDWPAKSSAGRRSTPSVSFSVVRPPGVK